MSNEPPVSGSSPKKPASGSKKPVPRGLVSLSEARASKGGITWGTGRFWMMFLVLAGASLIVWWKVKQGRIIKLRNDVLSQQRAVALELGPKWNPLRDKVEKWTATCGTVDFREEKPSGELLAKWDFRSLPGIYLRLSQSHSQTPQAIRAAAKKSLHDGFTSCLIRAQNPSPLSGDACETTQDCAQGQLCNEFSHCQKHSQPYNLRVAYKALHILTDEWIGEIQALDDQLILRGVARTFDSLNKYDLPVAVDLLQKARYFLVVVDEPAEAPGLAPDKAPTIEDGEVEDRSIPLKPHDARVCLWDLKSGEQRLAMRLAASGALMGGKQVNRIESQEALQRQANSCALAMSLRESLNDPGLVPAPAPSGSAVPAPSGSAAPAPDAP